MSVHQTETDISNTFMIGAKSASVSVIAPIVLRVKMFFHSLPKQAHNKPVYRYENAIDISYL